MSASRKVHCRPPTPKESKGKTGRPTARAGPACVASHGATSSIALRRRKHMSEAATRCETGRPTLHYFQQAAVSRGELAGDGAGSLGLAPDHHPAISLESCSAPELGTP